MLSYVDALYSEGTQLTPQKFFVFLLKKTAAHHPQLLHHVFPFFFVNNQDNLAS